MERRELFKTIAGIAAGAGVVGTVKVAEASERTVPALAIIETSKVLSRDTAERISVMFAKALEDTPFKGMKAIVLSDGLKLTMLDAQGRVLNREIDQA